MTDKGIDHRGVVVGDYFFLYYLRTSTKKLQYYLDLFNEEDYWIYKRTGKQRLVSEEWKEFKYSGYIFFKKDVFKKEDIDKWLDFIWSFTNLQFLDKPFPPIEIMKKIKVIK